MKKTMAFISRHAPTSEQEMLAKQAGYTLIHVGDCNAFDMRAVDKKASQHDAVAVVHPAAVLALIHQLYYADQRVIGIFENANRSPEGERPDFRAKALHIYRCGWGGDEFLAEEEV